MGTLLTPCDVRVTSSPPKFLAEPSGKAERGGVRGGLNVGSVIPQEWSALGFAACYRRDARTWANACYAIELALLQTTPPYRAPLLARALLACYRRDARTQEGKRLLFRQKTPHLVYSRTSAPPCALDVNRNFDLHVFSRAGPVAAATNLADKSAHPVLA